MKTIVMGKNIKNTYEVLDSKNEDGTFKFRPTIRNKNSETTWEEICSYDGEPQYVQLVYNRYIYLSEDEKVLVPNQVFRADLGSWIQYTDKVLSVDDTNLEDCEEELAGLLKEYNKEMIEGNTRAKAYCDLHKLHYAETDYDELLAIIGKPCECNVSKVWLSSAEPYPESAIVRITNDFTVSANDTVFGKYTIGGSDE